MRRRLRRRCCAAAPLTPACPHHAAAQVDGEILVEENFLPLDRPVKIAVTSGASTPDSVVQECMEAITLVKNLAPGSEVVAA